MSTYVETDEDLPRIIEQIRHLAEIREHRISRQLGQLDKLTLKAAQSMRSYLNRQPSKRGTNLPAVSRFTFADEAPVADIAAQVEHATEAARSAIGAYAKAGGAPASDEPARRVPEAERPQSSGHFLHDGKMYKVIKAIYGSGNLYAKRLDTEAGEWVMAKGMLSYLRETERMTEEQVIAFSATLEFTPEMKLYGKCTICGRPLTDETSIRNKVGPGPHKGV